MSDKMKINNWTKGISLLFLFSGMLFGCIESQEPVTPEKWLTQQLAKVDKTKLTSDVEIIDDSLERWELTPFVLTEPNGVRYVVDEVGTGQNPTLRSVITVKYVAKILSTGETFNSSNSLVYPLYNLILGWQTTLPLLKVGTKATLYIPSGLAYGTNGVIDGSNGDVIVPPNANLIFEIELLNAQ